jgi:hypothetical protein
MLYSYEWSIAILANYHLILLNKLQMMEAHSLFPLFFDASQMAGFALYTRYKAQFMKILDIISGSFLPALKHPGTKVKAEATTNLEYYITGKLYLKEPEGRHLAMGLLSRDLAV